WGGGRSGRGGWGWLAGSSCRVLGVWGGAGARCPRRGSSCWPPPLVLLAPPLVVLVPPLVVLVPPLVVLAVVVLLVELLVLPDVPPTAWIASLIAAAFTCAVSASRSEERRVGKECMLGWCGD